MKHKSIRILYIRPFSGKGFGAEEQDLKAGLIILKSIKGVVVIDVKIDLNESKVLLKDMNSDIRLTIFDIIKFIFGKYTTLDHAMTQAFTFKNYRQVIQTIKRLDIDIVMTNTTSTVLFGNQKYARHIFRSVSFEPIYVLKTVEPKLKALIHSSLKFQSLGKELKANTILCISPRDARFYKQIGMRNKKVELKVMPLRQLTNHKINLVNIKEIKNLSVGFLGSTYNVLHNRKSLEFISECIPKNFWLECDVTLNIYGKKIPTNYQDSSKIKFHNWVKDIDEIYKNNLCFIVPYFLSSGMQSKVFEPLIRGRILICDPRVLSEYPFHPYEHFIPARKVEDYIDGIKWIKNNPFKVIKMSKITAKYTEQIIGKDFILSQTINTLGSTQKSNIINS